MSNVKICPKCGKENDRYFVVCGKCGTSLDGVDLVAAETGEKVQETASAVNGMASAAKNRVAFILKAMAVITYVCAFICGIAFGSDRGDFYFGIAIIYWAAGFISGSMMLGFSEIIRLLHEINQKK